MSASPTPAFLKCGLLVFMVGALVAGGLTVTAISLPGTADQPFPSVDCGRATAPNGPPYIQLKIPDFAVKEGCVNTSMKDLNLSNFFSDPDLPPAGDDSLSFTVDNSVYPSAILGSLLTFGAAPVFPGKEDHLVVVAVNATDKAGLTASMPVNITVVDLNRLPEYRECNNTIEIMEGEVSYYDLNKLFFDPEGDPLNFTYLGGATDNLMVEISPNGSAVFRPAANYFTAQEILRFRTSDPEGANRSGELIVRVRNLPDMFPPSPVMQIPDPLEDIRINETETVTFHVVVMDGGPSRANLTYRWSIDDMEQIKNRTNEFTWETTLNDSGEHRITVRISDRLSHVDAGWDITVVDFNRAPMIMEVWPQNNTEVAYGAALKFCATAVDPDGDPLTFYWRLYDGTLLKTQSGVRTSSFSKVLAGGKQHIVVLEVQDGKGGVARQYIYVKVGADPSSPDDFSQAQQWLNLLYLWRRMAEIEALVKSGLIGAIVLLEIVQHLKKRNRRRSPPAPFLYGPR